MFTEMEIQVLISALQKYNYDCSKLDYNHKLTDKEREYQYRKIRCK